MQIVGLIIYISRSIARYNSENMPRCYEPDYGKISPTSVRVLSLCFQEQTLTTDFYGINYYVSPLLGCSTKLFQVQ